MKRLLLVAPAVLLALACTLPPYNEDLSLAQMSAVDMDLVTAVGPFKFWPGDLQDKEVIFYPSKDALNERLYVTPDFPLRGFALTVGDYYGRMVFIDHDGLDYYTGPDRGLDIDTSDPDRFSFTGQSVWGLTPQYHVGAAVFRPEGARWYVDFDQSFNEGTTDLNAGGPAIGASFFPLDGGSDFLHVLRRIGPEAWDEDTRTASGGGLGGSAVFRSPWLPGLPEEIESAFYFHNPNSPLRPSYLSWYDPARREYRNFRWDDSVPTQLHVMTHLERRIDLVLSNGWLFSRGENLGYLYDGEGRFLNQFALGGLNLVYEVYLGPAAPRVPHVVFTIEAWAPGGSHEDPRLYFLVYTLPTSELADL